MMPQRTSPDAKYILSKDRAGFRHAIQELCDPNLCNQVAALTNTRLTNIIIIIGDFNIHLDNPMDHLTSVSFSSLLFQPYSTC